VTGRWTCVECAKRFEREKSGARPILYCSQTCYRSARAKVVDKPGVFKSGQSPWNKGIRGLQHSPSTQWKAGQKAINWLPVGSETVRVDKNGKPRCFVKTAEPNVWNYRAVIVWENHNGRSVPGGYVVHHIDRDSLNDVPNNLQAMTRSAHIAEHRSEFSAKNKDVHSAVAL